MKASLGRWVVCCGWPYVNDRPHLGTFTQILSADVYARYLRLKGEDVVMVSGSDEHGTPIEVEAIKLGVSPKTLTDKYHKIIVDLLKTFQIQFDNYTRTESKVHKDFTQDFYLKVEKHGFVYTENTTQLFCLNDKRFLPDRFVEGECPYCHDTNARGDQCDNCGRVLDPKDLIKPRCTICGQTPVQRESKQWLFDLPKLSEPLRQYIEMNTNFPENARNFSLAWIRDGLKPRSITRDNTWGIPAPFEGAKGKTIYVWMEAVLGYVSATKEWAEKKKRPSLWKKFWFDPESHNVHFIGKDNIPFHVVIFPGLLLSTKQNYSLPWEVASTEYVQLEGQKFSRSRRIGVWMDEALELEGPEYWRYALVSLRPEQKDTNFTWEEFERKINTELNDVIGNFIHRTISFTQSHFKGKVPKYSANKEQHSKILASLKSAPTKVNDRLGHFRLKDALEQIVELGREGNRYLNEHEPWRIYKTDVKAAGETVGLSIQVVATLGILLQPFLPATSKKILATFSGKRHLQWKSAGKAIIKPGTHVRTLQPLFHKVSAPKLRTELENVQRQGCC